MHNLFKAKTEDEIILCKRQYIESVYERTLLTKNKIKLFLKYDFIFDEKSTININLDFRLFNDELLKLIILKISDLKFVFHNNKYDKYFICYRTTSTIHLEQQILKRLKHVRNK